VITVQIREEGGRARVSVSDNGKGWPKENRQRLLEPYVTTREKGTGLGLAIVARIIEQHGGSVDLIDAEPDENGRVGACFSFTLPLTAPDADDDAQSMGNAAPIAPEASAEIAATQPISAQPASQQADQKPAPEGQEEPPVMAVEKT
jgi:two-component system nitrogen regulation sensor histidine kinase NtrY